MAHPLGEARLEVRERGDARPFVVGRCTEDAEDLEDFVDFGVAREERLACAHFGEDAAHGPHVDAGGVGAGAEQDFGGAVPEGDDLGVLVECRVGGVGLCLLRACRFLEVHQMLVQDRNPPISGSRRGR